MSATLTPTPVMQFLDSNGNPLSGGLLYTYAAGTSTPLATYTDYGGATPNANPVVLNSRGEASIWLSAALYKFILRDSTGALIWTADNIGGEATLAALAASNGSSLVGYISSGTGAVATTVQAKLRQTFSVFDFLSAAEITAVQTNTYTTVTSVATGFQSALTAAAGNNLFVPAGTYRIGATLSIPSSTVVYGTGAGSVLAANQSSANFITTTSSSNVVLRDMKFNSAGTYSLVSTFTTCTNVLIQNVIFDGLRAGVQSSTAFRSYGSTNITIENCQFYDFDSCVYLDKSGATVSDNVKVLTSLFKHTVTGQTDTPTGVYQLECANLLVDGCTFVNIIGTVGGTQTGYSVYEGDGTGSVTTVVTNCLTTVSTAKAHVMVQSAQCPTVMVENNRFYGTAAGVGQLCKIGKALGSVLVRGNRSSQGGIFILGGATAATALRFCIIDGNIIQKLEQSTSAIRIGVQGSYFVSYAEIKNNSSYCTVAGSLNISECEYAIVEGNTFLNWNTGNYATPTTYAYTAGIYWQQDTVVSYGVIRDNILKNDTKVGGDTGYCQYGIACESATAAARVQLYNNTIGTMLVANFVNCLAESGVYTPTLYNTANVAASTAYPLTYSRNGNAVTVAGVVTLDPTAAAPTATQLGVSLPIASNFADGGNAGGSGLSANAQSETYAIYSDATNDRVVLDGLARDAANHAVWINFTYLII